MTVSLKPATGFASLLGNRIMSGPATGQIHTILGRRKKVTPCALDYTEQMEGWEMVLSLYRFHDALQVRTRFALAQAREQALES